MQRFKMIYRQTFETFDREGGELEIWVDTQTGVNYLFRWNGDAGGLTPLLDGDGKPLISR